MPCVLHARLAWRGRFCANVIIHLGIPRSLRSHSSWDERRSRCSYVFVSLLLGRLFKGFCLGGKHVNLLELMPQIWGLLLSPLVFVQILPNLRSLLAIRIADRQKFRFGNGRWGRALYWVVLRCNNVEASFFSLLSPGVPVLAGTRDLIQLSAVLSCSVGRCVARGKFKMTREKRLVLDYVKDILVSRGFSADKVIEPKRRDVRPMRQRISVVSESSHCRACFPHHLAEAHGLLAFDLLHLETLEHVQSHSEIAARLNLSQRETELRLQPVYLDSASIRLAPPMRKKEEKGFARNLGPYLQKNSRTSKAQAESSGHLGMAKEARIQRKAY